MRALEQNMIQFLRLATFMLLILCSQTIFASSLEKMDVTSLDGNRMRLHLKMSDTVASPKSFAIDNPARICLDFDGVKNGLSREASRPEFNVGVIKRVSAV